jgi:hypothetical protein
MMTSPDLFRDVIDEMLGRLESVTMAGQLHLMNKILAALGMHPMSKTGGPTVTSRLDDLRNETAKALPDGSAFAYTARVLMTTIATDSAAR